MSLFDLLVAQALLDGMARGGAVREIPKNFFVLQQNSRSWQGLKDICKKGNNVIGVEVTNGQQDSSKRMQQVFLNLAREHDEMGFFRAEIEQPGFTFPELREDLGNVTRTPTFIFAFFRDGGISCAKFEGEEEIKTGIRTGQIDSVIKELMERRAKHKLAEHLAEGLAEQMARAVADRENRLKEEAEEKRRKEAAEKEEQKRKEEAERRKREEEEQRAREEAKRRDEEIRRQMRPQVVEELLRTDVDAASVKVTKELMAKLGISTVDCLSKDDLKKKLMDNVPEYRMAQQFKGSQQTTQQTTQQVASNNVGTGHRGSISDEKMVRKLEIRAAEAERNVDELEQQRQRTEAELEDKTRRLSECVAENLTLKANSMQQRKLEEDLQKARRDLEEKDTIITSLKTQLMRAAPIRSASTEAAAPKRTQDFTPTSSRLDGPSVKQLEIELLETRMLYTTSLENYEVLGMIHNNGPEGQVLRVKCTKNGIPNPNRVYAMKVLPSYHQQSSTVSNLQKTHRNEYQILCQLPPHENIIHLYAFFYDRADPALFQEFKTLGPNARTLSLFLLLEELPMSLKSHMESLATNKGPQVNDIMVWFEGLLRGLIFLESQCVAHRDLKMDNLLLNKNGKVVIADFGKAIVLNDKMETPYMHSSMDIGGNEAHLGPEILNARAGPTKVLSYRKQPVWSAGVLAYEMAGHKNPFELGHLDQRAYDVCNLPPLEYTFCASSINSQRLPQKFSQLVKSMLFPDPSDRPTLTEALQKML